MTSWTKPSAAPRTTTRPPADSLLLIGFSFARTVVRAGSLVDAPLARFWRIVPQRGMSLKSVRECSDKVRGRHRIWGEASEKLAKRWEAASNLPWAASRRLAHESVPQVDNMPILKRMATLIQ